MNLRIKLSSLPTNCANLHTPVMIWAFPAYYAQIRYRSPTLSNNNETPSGNQRNRPMVIRHTIVYV